MINNAMLTKINQSLGLFLLFFLTLASCKNEGRRKADVSNVELKMELLRFDKSLYESRASLSTSELAKWRSVYGSFPDMYARQLIGIKAEGDSMLAVELSNYINDRYINEVNLTVQQTYHDLEWLRKDLEMAFKNYHIYFPEKLIPKLITYVAPFNYNMMATDSILGIGLDMYLGDNYKYYPTAGFPLYKIKKLKKEFIVIDAMNSWLQSDYELDISKNDLLNNMVHEGKMIYATSLLLPELPDTLLIGYSTKQLAWCRNNEEHIWKFFIEHKLLFEKNPGEFIKFINDGATTGGFPAEAPAKIGTYIGWQIVSAYMEKNTSVSLEQLMNEKDGNKILLMSNYKPKKNS